MEPLSRVHQRGGRVEVPEAPAGASPASESLVREISALWTESLGQEVGADDDFFTLGGNSLLGIRIIEQVAEIYGVALSVRDFYLAATPARVAGLIERGKVLS